MEILWENRGKHSLITAYFKTLFASLFDSTAFFRALPSKGNFLPPLFFGVICQTLAIVFQYVYNVVFQGISSLGFSFLGMNASDLLLNLGVSVFMAIIFILFAPIGAVLNLFLYTMIFHLCLMVVGGNKKGLEATFRALAYSQGPHLVSIIPVLGWIIGMVWGFILLIIGVKEIHETSYPRSILAALIPMILCCSFLLLVGAAILAIVPSLLNEMSSMTV